jgi:hypothetical protein
MTKVEELQELKNMLDQGLIDQDEHTRLRAEVLARTTGAVPPMGATGLPFSVPAEPLRSETIFRNPHTGATVKVTRTGAFGLTLLFGCFYLAYKEVWLHAAIGFVLGFFSWGLSWLIYPFFAYRIIVDSYRRKGWIEADDQPLPEERRAEAREKRNVIPDWLIGDSPFTRLSAEERRDRAGRSGFILAMSIWAVFVLVGLAMVLSGSVTNP